MPAREAKGDDEPPTEGAMAPGSGLMAAGAGANELTGETRPGIVLPAPGRGETCCATGAACCDIGRGLPLVMGRPIASFLCEKS